MVLAFAGDSTITSPLGKLLLVVFSRACLYRRPYHAPAGNHQPALPFSKGSYVILPRQLTYLRRHLQFKQCCKNFRGRYFSFQRLDQLVDVRGFVRLQQREYFLFMGLKFSLKQRCSSRCSGRSAAGASVSRTSQGSSSHTSSHVATSFAPCLMSVFGPQEFLFVTFPGTAKTSRFCSSAQREVMRVPLYSAASTTRTPMAIPLMMRLRIGKFCGAGNVSNANSEISAPPSARI